LVAHEAFHYLRKTRQVAGRHGEIEADAFALKRLEQYREGRMPPSRRHAVTDGLVAIRPTGASPLVASAGVTETSARGSDP